MQTKNRIIDLTDFPQNPRKSYGGANGGKKCIIINGEDFMVKFPPLPAINKEISYTNSCVSEYIGCHIFELLGVPAQKTMLATFKTESGKTKLVVACKDMTKPGVELKPFAGIKNQVIDSVQNGYGTELKDIQETFLKQRLFDSKKISDNFWNMFIIDSLIGNWGYLYNSLNDTVELAPVYDCGSSLFPQAGEDIMKSVINNPEELYYRVFEIPKSAIRIDDKKINYNSFISSLENKECNEALARIYPRINMQSINNVIDETPVISDLQKCFYKTVLQARKELILEKSYNRLLLRNNEIAGKNTVFISPKDFGEEYIR